MILHGLRRALIEGAPVELEEIFAGIEAVTADDVARVAGDLIRRDRAALAVIGPFDESEGLRERDRRGLRVPLAVTPPVWLATGVELRVPITATTAGGADLVRVSPGPETVVAHADLAAGAAATLATVPPADGSYRYRLRLPARRRAPCRCACGRCGWRPSATSRPARPWARCARTARPGTGRRSAPGCAAATS